jgi:OOP family OmpA-OmpF porin
MKMSKKMQVIGLVLAMVLTMGLGLARAAGNCPPCPDNFIFLVDQSGSMYMHFGDPELKMAVSKRVISGVNDMVPGTNYQAALQLFAPVQTVVPVGPYDRVGMSKGISSIKDDQEIFGRQTPMGPGIMSLDPLLAKMKGNTAVILVSDGMANQGTDPVAEARAIYSKYPNVLIHIVSVADKKDKKGVEILTAINKLNNCSVMAEGLNLDIDKASMEKFVNSIFCPPKKEMPKEEVLILRGIHFDFDKYNIKSEWKVVLDEGVQTLTKRPNIKVMIEGHTDSKGTEPYNQKLSERRAKAVFDYFVAKGISASRMKTIGYGELRPKASNTNPNGSDNPEGRAINRRVELKVMQ